MYENEKMRHAETLSGMVEGGIKDNMKGVNSAMIYIRTFVNVTMYPSITKQKKIK
jgi:hypothetical protein